VDLTSLSQLVEQLVEFTWLLQHALHIGSGVTLDRR
jgi:hypothetical protein